jgi:hypothetical protein
MHAFSDAGSGPIFAPCRLQHPVELSADHARLRAHPAPFVLHAGGAPVVRDVDEDAAADRLAGQARACCAERDRDAALAAESEDGPYLLCALRAHDDAGDEAVDAGVRRVGRQVDGAGEQLPRRNNERQRFGKRRGGAVIVASRTVAPSSH